VSRPGRSSFDSLDDAVSVADVPTTVHDHEHDRSHDHGHDHAQDHADEHHRSHITSWLRAAVLGANDGLLSTASLLIGVASGDASRSTLALTGSAALVAGALSMAAGEYASVASQRDAELADLEKERRALERNDRSERVELARIYEQRGLSPELARSVAAQLHAHDALGAHARDELGLDPDALAHPTQAALISAASFACGALLAVLSIVLTPGSVRIAVGVLVALAALAGLGWLSATLGGATRRRAMGRIVVLGGATMAVTALIGNIAGAAV
jgi:vacuolar iron transporter family protein